MNTYTLFDDIFELNDVVQSFLSDTFFRGGYSDFPQVKLYENKDTIAIQALVPGVRNEDLNVHLVNTTLVIEGEKKGVDPEGPSIRRERSFGKFQKSIKLPYRVKGDEIKAELKNGILTIQLNRSEESKPKRIEIR